MSDILNPDEETDEAEAHADRIQELKEAARRGDMARMVQANPLFDEYFDKAQAQLVEAMTGTDLKQDLERYRLTVALQTLDKLRHFVRKVAEEGEFSEKQLKQLSEGPRKRFF